MAQWTAWQSYENGLYHNWCVYVNIQHLCFQQNICSLAVPVRDYAYLNEMCQRQWRGLRADHILIMRQSIMGVNEIKCAENLTKINRWAKGRCNECVYKYYYCNVMYCITLNLVMQDSVLWKQWCTYRYNWHMRSYDVLRRSNENCRYLYGKFISVNAPENITNIDGDYNISVSYRQANVRAWDKTRKYKLFSKCVLCNF